MKAFILSILFTFFALFTCTITEGRAGGGGRYSGGSSFGRSYSSGSSFSGTGRSRYSRSHSSSDSPFSIITCVIIALLGGSGAFSSFFFKSRKGATEQKMEGVIDRFRHLKLEKRNQHIIDRIKAKDPDFDLDILKEKISTSFTRIQYAWSNHDLKSVRHFISDGIYERFSIQLAIARKLRQQNIVKNITINSITCIAARSNKSFDSLHFRISATALDYYTDTESGKTIHPPCPGAESFIEYWSFIRKPGVKTLKGKSLQDNFCPNCGTSLQLTDTGICDTCKSLLNSGEFDWVLAEITQEGEWTMPQSISATPGVRELQQSDPSFNIQHLEDRVSVIFWRHMAAQFYKKTDYLAKVATREFVEQNKADFAPRQKNNYAFYADAAVGSVALQKISCDQDGFDRAYVHVKWSGHWQEVKKGKLLKPAYHQSRLYQNLFVLKRKSGVQSAADSISSSHCPGCGAPETISTKNSCDYCHIPLNDGSRDWVLERIDMGQNWLPSVKEIALKEQVGDIISNEAMLACMAAAVCSDGSIHYREEMELNKFALSRNIKPERVAVILQSVQENGAALDSQLNTRDAKELMKTMIRICMADGKIVPEEQAMLELVASHMNYSKYDIEMLMKYVQINLYKQAKEATGPVEAS